MRATGSGLPYRLTQWVQSVAIRRADAMVMLTEAVRRKLFGAGAGGAIRSVIPCCADLASFNGRTGDVAGARTDLDAGERPILIYVGKFTGWYLEREMVDFFATAARFPDLLFVVLTQSERAIIEREFARRSIGSEDYR